MIARLNTSLFSSRNNSLDIDGNNSNIIYLFSEFFSPYNKKYYSINKKVAQVFLLEI